MVKVIIDFNLLTSKQKKVYSAIETFIKTKGIPPTVREIGEMVGEKTPGAVQGILNRLEQKGVIKRKVGMARSIQLVSESSLYLAPVYIPELKKITSRNANDLLNIYNIRKYHPVSPDIVVEAESCFIIKCPDNSMSESGINYEDMLVINHQSSISDNNMVLAVYENHVILRQYGGIGQDGMITLKADSDLIGKEAFRGDEILILGKLVCKYTTY